MENIVSKYLELQKEYNFNISKDREPLLLKELTKLKEMMTEKELESLRGHISERAFFMGILTLIKAKNHS